MSVFYDGVKDLILTVGTDVIRDSTEDQYDAKKLTKQLEEYIDRERAVFENVDIQQEINFSALEEYIKANLLSDFKESLCGNTAQRKTKKKSILEKLYRYLGAEADIRKKQYVDKIYDTASTIIGTYYTQKIPVEQKYIHSKAQDEIMEALNQTNEELKKMRNEQRSSGQKQKSETGGSLGSLAERIQDPLLLAKIEKVYRYDVEKFIDKSYESRERLREKYELYSEFFKMFVEVTEEKKGVIQVDDLFDFVKTNVNKNVGEDFIQICGPDGTGKTPFLMILYQYLYDCFLDGEIDVYPYYIDLHYYEWKVVDVADKDELGIEAEKCMRQDLAEVAELGKSGIGLLFLIDGNDNYFRTNLKPGPILESVLKNVEKNILIICTGEKPNIQPKRKRKPSQIIERVTSYTFRFSPVYTGEREKCREIAEQYCALEWKRENQEKINTCIKKFNIKEIDYNLLTIFKKCLKKVPIEEIASLNELYNRYCMIHLNGNDDRLKTCEEMAYIYFMTDKWIEQEHIAQHQKEWELVHQHKSISNYLIACYYADIILKCDEDRKDQLESIFTNGINIFLKSIINEDAKNQADALKGCKLMLSEGNIQAKSQAAYILGRIHDEGLQEDAKKILEEQKELLQKSPKYAKDSLECFFLRTIYVSLLYLGENDAGEEFLASLFRFPVMNEVNRAFYLQYYDDVKQPLVNMNEKNINVKDNGTDSITNTANILLNYTELQLNVKSLNWSAKDSINFQIHLFTLCSLLQVRLEDERIEDLLPKVRSVISRTLEQERANISDDMKIYLNMLKDDIENGKYSSGHIYDELYGVKDIERSGWLKKIEEGSVNVAEYENVAEHMYYAWLMGMLYLPETPPESTKYIGYQKEEILRCLLIHDLAEKYTEDKLPEEHTREHEKAENEWMHKIFMHDTYDKIASMDAYRRIWEQFGLSSNNINGKIAKEIDIIQSIYQFCVYKEMGAEFKDNREEKWRAEKDNIRTEIGRSILKEVVLKRFDI